MIFIFNIIISTNSCCFYFITNKKCTIFDRISEFYYNVLKERQNSINECLKNIMDDFDICYRESNLKLVKLADDMDKIGYLFEEEIRDLINEKNSIYKDLLMLKKLL